MAAVAKVVVRARRLMVTICNLQTWNHHEVKLPECEKLGAPPEFLNLSSEG